MEFISAVAAQIVQSMVAPFGRWLAQNTVAPVGQWLGYSFYYNRNIENMKKQQEKLQGARDRVKHSIDAAVRKGEAIEADVNKWLENVDVTMVKAKDLLEGEEKAKMKCSNGTCLNLKLRHKQSKKAMMIVQDIDEVLENGRFDKVSYRPTSQGIVTRKYMDYKTFESRTSTVKGLMEALRDANINMIGVWGMPGAGKTTLVRDVARQAKEEKLFNEVTMAAVMQSPDPRRIQEEIADMLDLKFDVNTVLVRANILRERLKRDNTVLVILDDIWEKLDLEAIGIPCNEKGIPCNGCKVVLTSRNRDILSAMGTEKEFMLDVLSPDEAWSLFEKMVGDSLKDPKLRSIAIEVSNECAGLPIALVTVSMALKNKSEFEWKDALQQLRTSPSPIHLIGMQKTIYSKIRLSYEHLESPVVKSFFLLCGQMSSAISYQDLLKYCFGLCLFPGISTLEEARNKVYTLVRCLKDSCLLLEDPHTTKYVRMHDLIRDVAIFIAKTENALTMRNDDPVKWPEEDTIKMCTSISVRARDIHELPDTLECPELRFLCVTGGEDRSIEISDTFFKGMRKLKVLDFTRVTLSSLPSSINLLTNLQTLCLDQCMLGNIAMIGELKNLEILSLIWSEFKHLPREIGDLTRLRLLDLSNCSKLEVIPHNLLSRLTQLEELYLGNSFTQWVAEGLHNEMARLAELKHLSHLTTLDIHIQDANILPKDLDLLFLNLKRYRVYVGDVWDWFDKHDSLRALKLKLNTSFQSQKGIRMLLNGVEDLCLDELKGVKSVLYELDTKGFQQLQHLHVQNNAEIKYIVDSTVWVAHVVFPSLKAFSLKSMNNLEEICHGQLPSTSFHNLRVVRVENCDKLKFVFPSSIARGLSQVQELEIKECRCLCAIVVKEEGELEDRDMILFPQLHHLVLERLPKLVSFLRSQNSFIGTSTEITPEGACDYHSPILQEQVVFPNLKRLELCSIDSEDIQHKQHWERSSCQLTNMQAVSRFQNLSFLEVQGSGSLKFLLSSSTVRFMEQLKHFHIVECKVVEEIVLMENLGGEKITPKVLFPRLECLKLNDLPMLKRFCIGSKLNFPSLTVLHIEKCPKLKSFIASSGIMVRQEIKEMDIDYHTAMHPLFNEEVAFPCLEVLEISYMDNLQIIWPNDFSVDSFCKLEIMKVEFCEKLISIFQSNILARFQSLETLALTNCGLLQEVFELQGLDFKETHAVTTIQLKVLLLINLPKMKHVWNKDPQGFFSFQYLKVIHAVGCHNLKSLFPASMAKSLLQLENLLIYDCGLEEIVAGEEGDKAIARFRFPQVTALLLLDLPGLKWFYPGVHTSEWPMLREICMVGCENVETLASGLSSFQETLQEGQLNISIQQPFFLVEEAVFPNLEILRLMNNQSIKEIWHGKLLGESFCKLKVLEVIICSNKSFSLSSFLQKLDSLEKLVLINSFMEEIFTYEEILPLGKHARILTQLKELKLSQLPMLTHLWKEDIEPSSIFQNLETLELSLCGKLKTLVPSSVSFQNLTNLEVSECHGLINLVTSTAAKSLVQLKKLSVSGCKRIIEIVASEGDEVNDVINFCKLAYLKLENLPNLTNFCSGSYSFEFPSLEEVIVQQCPEMKIFSHGVKSTPKLHRVKTTDEDEWHGKLDLNTTVQLVWEYTMTMPFVQSNALEL